MKNEFYNRLTMIICSVGIFIVSGLLAHAVYRLNVTFIIVCIVIDLSLLLTLSRTFKTRQ